MAGKKRNPSDDVPVLATGDADPFTYGGGVVYYQPEYDEFLWVFWDEPLEEEYPEIEDAVYRVHQFRYAPDVDLFGPQGELSWAADELKDIARWMGMEASELRRLGRGNFIEQHVAADAVRGYWGAENLDHEPFEESHRDLLKRYEKDHEKALKLRGEQALRRVESLRMGRRVDRGRNPSHRAKKSSRKKNSCCGVPTYSVKLGNVLMYEGASQPAAERVLNQGRCPPGQAPVWRVSAHGEVIYEGASEAAARRAIRATPFVASRTQVRCARGPVKARGEIRTTPVRKLKNRLMR